MLLLWTSLALGAPADAPEVTVAPRALKVDLIAFEPGEHPWGSDWRTLTREQWTAVVVCEPVKARVERCTFPHGVTWGTVGEEGRTMVAHELPTPGELRLTWAPRGRLTVVDLSGPEGERFGEEVSNTHLQMLYHRSDVVLKPDAQREVGASLTEGFVRRLAGALELELSKKKDPDATTWRPGSTPRGLRRFTTGVASHKLELTRDGDTVTVSGRLSERAASGASDYALETQVAGTATLDPASLQLRSATIETRSSSTTGPVVGYRRGFVLVRPWGEGDGREPADLPAHTLE